MTAYIFDTETTGVVEPIEVVEAAWVRLDDDLTPLEWWDGRFRPSKPIELGAMAVHHIMDEDLVGGACLPPSSDFKLPDDCTIVIGHNIDFDWKVAGSPRVRRIDVMAMTWKVWPELGKVSQSALIYFLDRQGARERLKEAHGALADVRNCLFVLRRIAEQVPDFNSWEERWRFSEEARVPDVMPFGKHKGLPMAEVPHDYFDWLLRQPDVDIYLRRAIARAIAAPGATV